MQTQPAPILEVLNRAAGDATGNPIEAGQAYAALAAYKALLAEVDALLAKCPEGADWRMTNGRGFAVSVHDIDDLRAARNATL